MATATLENVNKFDYLGLRRRPTYNEIIGLIKENEILTGELPNRDATFFKASNEGSFFDGMDSLEVLKEQQQRILQRQVQDLLLRQTVRQNGGTFHLERHRQSSSGTSSSTEVQPDRDMLSAQVQADLQQRQQQLRDRQQQTGQASQSFLERTTSLPVISGMMSSLRGSGARSVGGTPLYRNAEHFDLPSNDPPQFVIGESESEAEMMTARANPEDAIKNALQSKRPDASEGQITRVSEVLLKYNDLKPEQIATNFSNFTILNQIYRVLNRNGFIQDNIVDEYQTIANAITMEGGGRKRASLLRQLADHYRTHVYDEYINNRT